MRTLWIVGAGWEAVPGIRRGKQMGLRVVASDANPRAPGFDLADSSVVASVYDPAETVAAARGGDGNGQAAAPEGPLAR